MAEPVVTVRGEAQLEGPPDLASFSLTVHRRGNNQQAVQAGLAEASGQVKTLVEQFTAAIERSSTSGLHVYPVYGPRDTNNRVRGYRGSFSTEIVVHDFAALSPLVFALEPIPDTQLDGPYWTLRPGNTLYREVRLAAIAEARRRADDYAAAFDGTVSSLVEISDLEGGFAGPGAMRASFAMGKAAAEPPEFEFEPTVQTVTGQVTVRFSLAVPNLSSR